MQETKNEKSIQKLKSSISPYLYGIFQDLISDFTQNNQIS